MNRQLDDLLLMDENEIYGEAQRRIKECKKTGGRKLDFSCLHLTKIPPEIGELETLTELDISNAELNKIPAFIGKLAALKKLSIGSNCLGEHEDISLPPQLGNLRNLQNLSLGYGISAIPQWVYDLENIKALSIYNDTVLTIPAHIANITKLRKLRVYGMNITSLPREIGERLALTVLDINCPKLQTLPESFAHLKNMQCIRLTDCGLTAIPGFFCDWTNLEELEIGKEYIFPDTILIKNIPQNIGNLKKLKHLSLLEADIEKIPDSLGNCPLQNLHITGSFKTIPASLGNLVNLKNLSLHAEKLTTLPESMCRLKKLETLYLDTFALKKLPVSFGSLRSLKTVDIFSGTLTALPESMGALKNLKSLNIDAFNVTELPPSFKSLSYVKQKHIQIGTDNHKNGTVGFDSLVKMSHKYRWKILESFSLKKLEDILCSVPVCFSALPKEKEVFEHIMMERQHRLNRKFKWTDENKKRMVKVSDAFLQAWEDGFAKAKKMIKALNPVRDEYTVEIVQYPDIADYKEDGKYRDRIYSVITDYLDSDRQLSMCFHSLPAQLEERFRESIHVRRKLSWNIEGLGDIELADSYICYALHVLYSHNEWAFEDILKINNITTEIRITGDSGEF